MLLDLITKWQDKAKSIAPPERTAILPARGGLPGPAFFPEGFGLQNPTTDASWPEIMAIGHNFGCENYRDAINPVGQEDDKSTWRNLRNLLEDADVPIDCCYMTNWFIGLQPGDAQVGQFLTQSDFRYESECNELLLDQMRTLNPDVILLLGLPVVGRAHQIMPTLTPWANAANWGAVDSSSLGPVAFGVEVPGAGIRANVVALLHPSFSPPNQRLRRSKFPVEKPEAKMIRQAVSHQGEALLAKRARTGETN